MIYAADKTVRPCTEAEERGGQQRTTTRTAQKWRLTMASSSPMAAISEPVLVCVESEDVCSSAGLSKRALKRLERQAQRADKRQKTKEAKKASHRLAVALRREALPEVASKDPLEVARHREVRRREREASEANFAASCASGCGVAIDCDFEEFMTDREKKSLFQQLAYCYGANRRCRAPCGLRFVGIEDGGDLQSRFARAFSDRWIGASVEIDTLETLSEPEKLRIVYLTSDADDELEFIDKDAIYVIGGIVDRNRYKGKTRDKAQTLGFRTKKLPIGTNRPISLNGKSPVLAVNHVLDLLLYAQANGSFEGAASMLPDRKVKEPTIKRPASSVESDDEPRHDDATHQFLASS